ncbi:preprotein translocase subunit YajC [Pseudomonadota bacterium]
MLISPAYAQAAGGAADSGALMPQVLMMAMIFGVFYFLLIRPQQKKMKMHKAMLGEIRRGDRIVTGGGILGSVTKVIGDDELMVEIADGVKVRVARSMVSSVVAKPEAADKAASNDDDGDDDADDSKGDDKKGKKSGLKKLLGD